MAKGRDGAALENIGNGCGAYGFKRGLYILSGPAPTALNDLPTADDRTSADGHTSPGPKRPVRYIAFPQGKPGNGYSQNPLNSESGGIPCHYPRVRTHRSASSSCV